MSAGPLLFTPLDLNFPHEFYGRCKKLASDKCFRLERGKLITSHRVNYLLIQIAPRLGNARCDICGVNP